MATEIQKIDEGGITLNDVQDKIITIQNKNVLLDSDVAWLYGVDTNDVNQTAKRNPDKFPEGYIIALTDSEKMEVATICDNPKIKFSPTLPNAFKSPNDAQKQAVVMQKSSELLSDMVTKELQTTGTETNFEINLFSAVKIKHTIKKEVK